MGQGREVAPRWPRKQPAHVERAAGEQMNSRTRPQEAVVGRAEELATLAGALAPETAAQAVVLAGEPGIGSVRDGGSGQTARERQWQLALPLSVKLPLAGSFTNFQE